MLQNYFFIFSFNWPSVYPTLSFFPISLLFPSSCWYRIDRRYMAGLLPIGHKTQNNHSINLSYRNVNNKYLLGITTAAPRHKAKEQYHANSTPTHPHHELSNGTPFIHLQKTKLYTRIKMLRLKRSADWYSKLLLMSFKWL